MGKGNDGESIAATFNRAGELPDDTGGASAGLPQLFSDFPIPQGDRIVDNVKAPTPREAADTIPGVPKYPSLDAHLRRFVIGQIMAGTGKDAELIEEDDSQEYEALMCDVLQGKAMLRWEEKSTLKDGALVISVCYFTRKEGSASKRKESLLHDTKS